MSKRLITDRDVLEGRIASPLQLDGDTLITPSARDRCCRLGITVIEPGGGTGCSPRAAAGTPACTKCGTSGCAGDCSRCAQGAAAGSPTAVNLTGLPDGLYLVRVAAGRATSVLPAAGPGVMPAARHPGGAGR